MELVTIVSEENADQRDMNDMPEEVIIHIFSFLKLKDRKNTRLVCKLWNRLSYSFGLIRNDVTYIDRNYQLMRNPSPYSRHINISFGLRNGSYNCPSTRIIGESTRFWLNHCENIRRVNVYMTSDVFWVLWGIIDSCPTIEHIRVHAGCSTFVDFSSVKLHFPNLRILEVLGHHHVIFPVLNIFLRNAPRLHTIFVAFSKSFCKLKGLESKSDFMASIANALGHQLKRLTLKFSCGPINEVITLPLNDIDHSYITITNLKHLTLEGLQLGFLGRLSWDYLTSLSLNVSPKSITDDKLAFLDNLNNLSHLDMGFTIHHIKLIYEALCKRVRPKMTELRLRTLHCLPKYDIIKAIAPYLPNLRVLHVESVYITMQSFEALMTHNHSLQCLTLKGRYKEIPEYAFLTSYPMNKLIHLDVHAINIPKEIIDKMELPSLEVLIWTFGNYTRQIRIRKRSITVPRKTIKSARWGHDLLTCCKSPFVECFVETEECASKQVWRTGSYWLSN